MAKGVEKNDIKTHTLRSSLLAERRAKQPDFWLLLVVLLLLGIGTMMVFSASTASAYAQRAESTAYDILRGQIGYALFGVVMMGIFSRVSYKLFGRCAFLIYGGAILLLILVQTPLGRVYNGARRWLSLGIEFQPSEILKLAAVIYMAYVLSHPKIREKSIRLWGILIYGVPLILGVLLIFIQPHISCIVIVCGMVLLMMFVGGVKWPTFLVCIGVVVVCGVAAGIWASTTDALDFGYLGTRWNAFVDPESDTTGGSYQILQSLYAIGSGGLFGRGFGQSVQKYLYLPEPYNDFIFSVLAEELGFIGVAIVLILFLVLITRGYKISAYAPDRFSSLVAFGITTNIAIQTTMNIAVVSKVMPVTGVSLPFFSYGGTALVILMVNMGILLNISRHAKYPKF